MYNILVCDDEKDIVEALNIYLSSEGYNIIKAYNGEEAVKAVADRDVHLVLMDIMMPVMDGISAMTKIREKSNIPVILLTAKSEDTDKILGLNVGADDYVTKPFNPVELIARVKAQLRRYMSLGGGSISKEEDTIIIGGIVLDDKARTVTVDGENVNLTPTEYHILKLFMKNPGKVYSPKDIYKMVWEDVPLGSEGTVAVHIRHLREKIEITPSEPRYLKVVWGQGYKLEE
ncbi:MAG: response regulator transcription factor [Lachnospiraceae bacterium]|nr:response regulator transcription factor [Lachnospiraceae bacterium]